MWLGQFAPEKDNARRRCCADVRSGGVAGSNAAVVKNHADCSIPSGNTHCGVKGWRFGSKCWTNISPAQKARRSDTEKRDLPRSDRRFADPAWRDQPVYALIHQTYLLLAERIAEAVDSLGSLTAQERANCASPRPACLMR